MSLSKDEQQIRFQTHLENFIKENEVDINSLSVKAVDAMKIEGVNRDVKRTILKELKAQTKLVESKSEDVYVYHDFIEELYNRKDRLFQLLDSQRGLSLTTSKTTSNLKDELADIQKLDEQMGVSVKMNRDIHSQLKEYGRLLGGVSIREFVHIALKDLLIKLENINE